MFVDSDEESDETEDETELNLGMIEDEENNDITAVPGEFGDA